MLSGILLQMNIKGLLQDLPTVEQLQAEVQSLNTQLESVNSRLESLSKVTEASSALLNTQNEAMKRQAEASKSAADILERTLSTLESVRLATTAPVRADMSAALDEKQLNMLGTIDLIAEQRMSFARFGDGEIRLMMREEFNLRFQKNTPGLKEDLAKVFKMSSDKLLIGMPHRFVNSMWGAVFAENWAALKPIIEKAPVYGNSHVSRPIFFDFYQQAAVDAWKRVWDGRNALIVAGKGSRFELIDELFDNLGSSTVVEGPPRNAYVAIDSIMRDVVEKLDGRDLVLIALGPSGTVIAARLAEMGVQAIDIGHIAASYRAVFSGDAFPEMQPVSQLQAE